MAEKKESKSDKRRTQVKDLPKQEQELSNDEQKKIKGGPQSIAFFPNIGRTDGRGN